MMPHARTSVYAFLLIALSSGCSLAITRPASTAGGKPIDGARPCTRSMWLPALDVAGVIAGGIALGLAVPDLPDHGTVLTAVGAGMTALYTASASYGFATVGQCEAQRSRTTTPAQSPNGAPGPRNLGSESPGSTSLGSASSPNVSYSLSSRF